MNTKNSDINSNISNEQLQTLLPDVLNIAQQAGEKIMEVYKNGFNIEIKDDKSPLTTADLAANDHIVKELNKLSPHFPVLSEESKTIPFSERQSRETYWLVDPLDGTKEFIKRRDTFTVNIALIHQNKSILGVIVAPALNQSFYACRNFGSYKEDKDSSVHQIHARTLPAKPAFAGSRSHAGEALTQFLENVKHDLGDYDLVSMGSSLKMCLVAEGKVDLYPRLGLTSEWDTAAAHCIVDEAGGQLVKTDMSPLRYNTKDSLLNPFFFTIGDNDISWQNYLPENMGKS